MANVPYSQPVGAHARSRARRGRRWRVRGGVIAAGGLLVLVAILAAAAIVLVTSKPGLSAGGSGLAEISTPIGGATVQSVDVRTGANSRVVPVRLDGNEILPSKLVPAGELVSIDVVVKRPGWVAWLTGGTQVLHLTLRTPTTRLRSHFLTLGGHAPIRLAFRVPIREIAYGATPSTLHRRVLASPRSVITLPRTSSAGSLWVSAAPRPWETSRSAPVSWFPAGSTAAAVASPAPGARLGPTTAITLTFNKPVHQVLGTHLPPVEPTTPGTWHLTSSHTIIFRPEGLGYGLGANVTIGLPSGVRLVGAAGTPSWSTAPGSTLRLQELLANLGYLPLRFHGTPVAHTPAAEEAAAMHPPSGHFTWAYPNVPDQLRSFWSPGASGVMTEGALMAFQNDHGLTTDGIANGPTWQALITAAVDGRRSSSGYTFVMVDKESSPERLTLWHSGHVVMSSPVNTGVAAAPTASGTYPVFEHLPVTTMTGTNPDGSHYSDPGIQWVSYFNGGDALHAFTRAQYGFPQSDGCVEMPLSAAARVYPFTPIGTLVNVA